MPPAALKWDQMTKIDPATLHDCGKSQVDEVFDMIILVKVHFAVSFFLFVCFLDTDSLRCLLQLLHHLFTLSSW